MPGLPAVVVEDGETILMPLTGELVPRGDAEALAGALDQLKAHQTEVKFAISAFTEAIVAEARRRGTKTLNLGAVKVTLSADTEVVWDVEELGKLLDAGLPVERFGELVSETVTYKVNAAVANQISGANDEYKEIVERARQRVPKTQYATVSRK